VISKTKNLQLVQYQRVFQTLPLIYFHLGEEQLKIQFLSRTLQIHFVQVRQGAEVEVEGVRLDTLGEIRELIQNLTL
jgi:hypothetical protein